MYSQCETTPYSCSVATIGSHLCGILCKIHKNGFYVMGQEWDYNVYIMYCQCETILIHNSVATYMDFLSYFM